MTKIKDWMDTGEILRFIITDTEINFQVRISDFQYSQQDGTGDIYFTINLKEYREIKITTEQVETPTENKEREDTKEKNTDINNQNNNKDDKNSTLIISIYYFKTNHTSISSHPVFTSDTFSNEGYFSLLLSIIFL